MTPARCPETRRLLASTVLAAALGSLFACTTAERLRPASPTEAGRFLEEWTRFRAPILARGLTELSYDAEVSRRLLSFSGSVSALNLPGQSLLLRVDGFFGLPVARAEWDGTETRIRIAGKTAERTVGAGGDLSEVLGVPLSAEQISLMLFGLPDRSDPETLEFRGSRAWPSWRGGTLRCEFDAGEGHPFAIFSRGERQHVEIRYLGWADGIPTRIRIRSASGTADLSLRSAA
jgi:hypothetical protein